MEYDAIIIGGGAAGLFCALQAGKRGKRVLVIEHNADVGRKILISGGGRCNFTNRDLRAEHFVSSNPHFAKSALAGYTSSDFIEMVKRHRIEFYEKKLGQLFCRHSSRQIVEMLLAECRTARVTIKTACTVKSVSMDEKYVVETSEGNAAAKCLVVACGGLSFAKVGATDLGHRLARQFGHKIVETRPSLVALVGKGRDWPQLAGVSADAVVSAGKMSFRENILFTHRGLSGPAILQISNYWKKGVPVAIDLLPDTDVIAAIESARTSRQTLGNYLSQLLPHRLAQFVAERRGVNKPLDQLSNNELQQVSEELNHWQVQFTATEGYDRAEVTLGGVSTAELSSKTMESKLSPGLYFIGEVVDVTGWLGGYNFQWAWSSGHAAASAL
ncbi:MAG TPA: NAD(P)/FAD-dependent oxidoreductase [Pyrinomonadaceae bacterium]|nr:NAD(P)/FAD-dependent oxidoreductase [Chloracidobacterium sp.]MBP9935418.1 NAD(P)/FAD-dependent oxidoreductase [Pyrinomonadaceae bacterium]MBK7803587.1 NAD(P)/FAD-dependent oxidoreductase [Chloracidobacterium sp.]MBK9438832.1 NAD(P)/FAD-dependent oxidoreductase [Chloracidobacterium sp.]MBK9766909.1 NAD(P)/FAD-dependent oxidoreductase [Chloracidobacterium sp.]